MNALKDIARKLLEAGTVQVVIGFGAGSSEDRTRPLFVRKPEQADKLVFNAQCTQNLAVYLSKAEVKQMGKAALVGKLPTVRSVLQLAAESQVADGGVIVLAVYKDGVEELATFAAMEAFVAKAEAEQAAVENRIANMSREERWAFWQAEFSRCIKCFACRAACPMCYCTKCVVECNQPQWVAVPSHPLGVMEWHIVRAMHLAGRCVSCNACSTACPVDIPLNLLTQYVTQKVDAEFGQRAGTSANKDFALSTFKPEDKEEFIR